MVAVRWVEFKLHLVTTLRGRTPNFPLGTKGRGTISVKTLVGTFTAATDHLS